MTKVVAEEAKRAARKPPTKVVRMMVWKPKTWKVANSNRALREPHTTVIMV